MSTAASAFAAAIALSRVVDALFDVAWFHANMKPSTALAITVASIALVFAARFENRALRRFAGVILAFVGVVTVGGRLLTGIFGGWPWMGMKGPLELPSLTAGVICLFLGASLSTLDRGRRSRRHLPDMLALVGLLLAFAALSAFAHGATLFVPLLGRQDTGITLLASLALFALSLAIVLLPVEGFASILFSSAPGAGLARAVTAVALLVPPLLGVLLRVAPELGTRDVHARYALLMVVVSAVSVTGAFLAAKRLEQVDAGRRHAEEALRQAEASYRELVATAPDAIVALDDGVVTIANTRAAALFGRPEEVLRGTRIEELLPAMPDQACVPEPMELRARTSLTGARHLAVPVEATFTGEKRGRRTVILRDISERRRTELANRRLAAIVESSNDAILSVDPEGLIFAWNPGAERLFGWSAEEAIGSNLSLVIPEDLQSERNEVIKAAAAGPIPPYESERLRKDGSRFVASITVSAIRDDQHRLLGFSGVVRDISEQKRTELTLRAQEARFRLIFEHSADGIFVADLDARYADVNGAGCRMLRRTREEIVGRTIRDFIRPEDFARLAADREAVLAGQTIVSEWPMLRGDGTWATIEVATTLLPDGRWLGVTRDVSARREQQDELRRLHEAERGLRRLREEWTAVVAHDLRAPVTSIAISAQTLARRELGSVERQLVQRIENGAGRLRHMIDDLLDYAQIEAGRLRIRPQLVDLVALLSDEVERLSTGLERRRIQLHIEHAAFAAEVDPVRFDQVITNLVTNAAKYGDPDSDIEVRLGGREHQVEIAVSNRGPGMTEEEQKAVFDRFHRTPGATKSNIPGLGLGLFIVKGIVEAHGGRIEVESIPGQTTTFRVILPGERHSLAA